MILHNRLLGRARTSRSPASEVQTPPLVQPYKRGCDVNTSKLECGLELVRTGVCPLKTQVLLHSSCTNYALFRAVVTALLSCSRARIRARCNARVADMGSAINVQPNGNAPLLQVRR